MTRDIEEPPFKAVGFEDELGRLVYLPIEDCRHWRVQDGWIIQRGNDFVYWNQLAEVIDMLASRIEAIEAARMLLSAGHCLPTAAQRALRERNQQIDNLIIKPRSKPRRQRRAPPGQYGLAGFANSKRVRDSRRPNGADHERGTH